MGITTTAQLIRTHGASRPERTVLIWGDDRMTYGELDRRSSQVAQGLRAAGVGPQDHVTILDKNAPEYFELLYGAAKLNAIHVAVNWRLAPPEVAYIVNDAQTKVFVVGAEFVPVLEAIADQLTSVQKILVIGADHEKWERWDRWREAQPADDPGVQPEPDDVTFQMYSSGTTGLPKGVMLTNRNLFTAMPELSSMMGMTGESVNLIAMPLFHIGGGGWATCGMFAGCPGVLVREVDPTAILGLIPDHGITHGFLVPAVLQFMLMIPGVNDMDFSTMECILYGASPISVEVLKNSIKTFGCDFMQAYGLTETTGIVVALMPGDHDPDGPNAHRLRSAGKPIAGVEVRIVDPASGEDVPLGEVGEIWIRTVQNMKGYWNLPEETAKSMPGEGWFRSGDAGYLDEDGYIYIHDRVKDMIVSGGENIYPAEVENVLMSHPAIADVAVIGVPSEKWGETPKAMVVRAAGVPEVSEAEIIEYCRERLAKFKCPTSVDWIEAIPRNPSGKILKKDLRKPFWEGRDRNVN